MIILGLGSNVGDRLANLRQVLECLYTINDLTIVQVSPIYESDALLPEQAAADWNLPYLNLAISCNTKSLTPESLFSQLQKIEAQMGRVKGLRWSPRIIDIDILAWHEEFCQTETLHIPHLGLLNRPFALWPLADLLPNWRYCVPGKPETGKTAQEIIIPWGSRFTGEALLHTKQIAHRVDTPQLVGTLNVTPDSFADGGKYNNVVAAVAQAKHLFLSGADVIDIGAESTRPNCQAITPAIEWQRLEPVLAAIYDVWQSATFKPKISIDTRNPTTLKQVLAAYKIDWINDQTGFDDRNMREIAAASEAKLVFMHHLCIPEDREVFLSLQQDLIAQIYQWAAQRYQELIEMGIAHERLIFDPGVGFGKHAEQSFELLQRITEFRSLNLPLLVGHSRKSFLNQFTAQPFAERDIETVIISDFLTKHKVDYLRVHNVEVNMRALKIGKALYAD